MRAKHGIAILRIGLSTLLLVQAWTKVRLLLDGGGPNFADPLGLGGTQSLVLVIALEAVFALLCLVGFYTRLAAVPLVALMGFAAFRIHGDGPFVTQELALLYGLGFAALIVGGSGAPSVDLSLRRRNLDEV